MNSKTGIVVYALHKSASMFLFRLFQNLAKRAKVDFYSIHSENEAMRTVDVSIERSFVYCPIRSFDLKAFDFPKMGSIHNIAQVRDPRDILVSQYFSLGWIHSDERWSDEDKRQRQQIREMSIDEYVLCESEFSRSPLLPRYRQLLPHLGAGNCSVVRYEDMVLRFGEWLKPLVKLFGFRFPWLGRKQLEKEYASEFRVSSESMQHRRRVIPGDYLEKLQPETIRKLNAQYGEILGAFRYAT